MANEYYERLSEMNPGDLADGLAMEAEFDAIAQGFSKLPTPHTGGQGFDGPVRVGDATSDDEAASLGQVKAAIGEAVLLPIATYGNLSAAAWETLPSNTYLLFGTGAQLSNTPYTLVAGSTYYLQVRHVIGGGGVDIYHDQLSLASTDDANNVDLRRLFVRTGSTFAGAVSGGWVGFALKRAALTALESLTPAADSVVYYTSGAAAAMTTITSAARGLLDDESISDMRETLSLGTIASVAGTFADFNAPDLFSSAINLISIRFAVSGFAPANKPPSASTWWYTMVYPRSVGGGTVYYRQTAISVITGETYERVNTSTNSGVSIATFGTWRKVYSQENILGPISQSGGLPTGGIIERGSNANGDYTKFADGFMVCTGTLVTVVSSTPLDGTNAVSLIWNFPATFSQTPRCTVQNGSSGKVMLNGGHPNISNSSFSCYVGSMSPFTNLTVTSRFIAIGYWY